VGYDPTIGVVELEKTFRASDRAVTVMGIVKFYLIYLQFYSYFLCVILNVSVVFFFIFASLKVVHGCNKNYARTTCGLPVANP
jgi:hypothetical protein